MITDMMDQVAAVIEVVAYHMHEYAVDDLFPATRCGCHVDVYA